MTVEKKDSLENPLDRVLGIFRGLVSRVAGPSRVAASLRFCPSRVEARARARRQQDPTDKAYRDAAVAWFTQRLGMGLDDSVESVERVELVAMDSGIERLRWHSFREELGELERVEVMKCEDLGSFAAPAGSYEPEVYGYAPTRVLVTLEITGSRRAADLVLQVSFINGPELPPSITQEKLHLRDRTPPRSLTDEERELEQLSEAVCAAPDDDAPRMQLADFWIARNEPRGQFIRAQLAGHETQAQRLLARHGAEWTDGLPVESEGRVYHRGFLSEAHVDCSPAALRASFDNPAWKLLTALSIRTHSGAEGELLRHAQLDSLRRISGVDGGVIQTSGFPRGISHLHVRSRPDDCPPSIEELEIETSRFDDLWTFSGQRRPHLKLLSVTVNNDPQGADLMSIARLLEEPLPTRVVLIGRSDERQSTETWRLTVTAAGWEFSGDERVLQTIHRARKTARPTGEIL